MYRDITTITATDDDCYYIVDDQTIKTFTPDSTSPTIKSTYKLINDKYQLVFTEPVSAFDAGLQCSTSAQIAVIPSRYDFISPIYHEMAIASILVICILAFRLIVYPFFRKRI